MLLSYHKKFQILFAWHLSQICVSVCMYPSLAPTTVQSWCTSRWHYKLLVPHLDTQWMVVLLHRGDGLVSGCLAAAQ